MKALQTILVTCSVFVMTGCYSAMDHIEEHKLQCRNHLDAWDSWRDMKHHYQTVPYRSDFKAGYKAGYLDIVNGGDGCQPLLPPRKYMHAHYQTPEGKKKALTWFEGFSHGAIAAEQDGAGHWNKIVLSPQYRLNMQQKCDIVLDKAELDDYVQQTEAELMPFPIPEETSTNPELVEPVDPPNLVAPEEPFELPEPTNPKTPEYDPAT